MELGNFLLDDMGCPTDVGWHAQLIQYSLVNKNSSVAKYREVILRSFWRSPGREENHTSVRKETWVKNIGLA